MNRESLRLSLLYNRLLTKGTPIVVTIVVLIAFYPLIGCSSGEPLLPTKTTATALPTNKSPSWKFVWGDDFDGPLGSPPDANKWSADVGGNGWGSQHLEYNTGNKNAYLDGKGNLILEARKENLSGLQCWYGPCSYTSARITTRGHFSFTYGLVLARIKVPRGQGIWSAFWLLGSDCETVGWPTCGEIDVMENIGQGESATIHGSTHGPENFSRPYTLPRGAFADDYHIFGIQWDPDHIRFIIDNINYVTLNKSSLAKQQDWVYNHPFDIILNLSVGGKWPGNPDSTTVFPQQMSVSYVNLYTQK